MPGQDDRRPGATELLSLDEAKGPARLPDSRPRRRPRLRGLAPLGALLTAAGTAWLAGSERRTLPGLLIAAGAGLVATGLLATQRRSNPYEDDELNDLPGDIVKTPVPGHGEVMTGRTVIERPGAADRPYISIWIVPARENLCGEDGEYRWYQFVQLKFFVDKVEKKFTDTILGGTGLRYPFGEWAPDYHKGDPECMGPDLRPPGLKLRAGVVGKPFRRYGIGGRRTVGGTSLLFNGVLDAPCFCKREGNRFSPIERLYRWTLQTIEQEQRQQPPNVTGTLRLEVQARTYLACVKGGTAQCIGYVPWTYVNEADLLAIWQEKGISQELGKKRYVLAVQLLRCRNMLTFAGFKPGCDD